MNANDSGAAPRAKGYRFDGGEEPHEGIVRSSPSLKLGSAAAALIPYFLTAILALVFFYSLYGIWGQSLKLPITRAGGDYLATAIFAKTAMQTGWCATNTHMGAPHGFECYDFPMPDGIHLGFFALFGRFTNDAVFAINVYYILGFVLIALTSLFVFRSFGFSTILSVPAGLLFAFLPHHYKRGEYHLFLSSYYLIPLMVMVIVWIYRGESFVTRRPGKRLGYRLTRKGTAGAILCVLMGCGGVYYAAFALLFLLTTALLLLLRGCRMLDLLPAGLAGALMVLTVVANLAPNLLYFREHGRDPEVAQRSFEEADMYGMKIAQLLLPITEHRLPAFERLKRRYLSGTDPIVRERESETMVALGLVMSLGFLILIIDLFSTGGRNRFDLIPLFSRLNLAAVLVATLGGFGSLFNLLVFPEIRVYARISVYIAFFSLVALLNGIARLQRRFEWTSITVLIINAAAAGVLLAGLWDLTPKMDLPHADFIRSYTRDRDFVRKVESVLPRGAMIYQLPYMSFPEGGAVNRMLDYEPARGFLYSDDLRWSYGAMRGRPGGEWQRRVSELPFSQMISTLKQSGFAGIWIDRFGYKDGGDAITASLQAALRVEPLRSSDSRLLFYPLAPYASPGSGTQGTRDDERLREAATALPMEISFAGCSVLETSKEMNWRWCGPVGKILVRNTNGVARTESVEMTLRTNYSELAHFHFGGDLWHGDVEANISGTPMSLRVNVTPGSHVIEIQTDATRVDAPGDTRDMRFRIEDFREIVR